RRPHLPTALPAFPTRRSSDLDVVRAEDTDTPSAPRARSLVRGHHQMRASEFTGDHDAGRDFQFRNDQLMYVADGAVEIEAEGRAYRLGRGDTLYLTGGVRHRWRATGAETRLVVVGVAEHIEAVPDRPRRCAPRWSSASCRPSRGQCRAARAA